MTDSPVNVRITISRGTRRVEVVREYPVLTDRIDHELELAKMSSDALVSWHLLNQPTERHQP